MILSNTAIFEAIDEERLVLDPAPSPRAQGGPYQTSAVDLRLGGEIAWLNEDLPANIDLRQGKFHSLFGKNSKSLKITDDQPYVLQPRKLVLGRTLERVELPLPVKDDQPGLAARIEGKSSYARCGLLVHFTAPTIHAGFAGTITLELMNLGPLAILLFPGMYICQLIFEEVRGHPFRNDSQFQGQSTPGGGG